ncbi:hypothetical protein HPB50_017021 [Hyalomma asiaticum]|uniref:Uncharacterized protein n=1 Tax=Hyalomma asiaticum TaxID=266040 RepID=A0ACB7RKA6_HYAAI|nr:hypothetical protein HPB50_017021 [Hyalomma asiaticum]
MDCVPSSVAIVQTIDELMDSDSEDEEFDDVVPVLALKLTRLQRNRIPKYCEEVVSRYFDFEFMRIFPPIARDVSEACLRLHGVTVFPKNDKRKTKS